jgi:hypothetical protein
MPRSETLSAYIDAPFDKVWDFISNPENLHLWTVDFAQAPPQKVGDIYKVQTPRGERDLFVKQNKEFGVIDFYFGTGGNFGCSPSRLIRSGDGAIYIFTQFEPLGAPPGLFEVLVGNVKKELAILKDLLESKEKI